MVCASERIVRSNGISTSTAKHPSTVRTNGMRVRTNRQIKWYKYKHSKASEYRQNKWYARQNESSDQMVYVQAQQSIRVPSEQMVCASERIVRSNGICTSTAKHPSTVRTNG